MPSKLKELQSPLCWPPVFVFVDDSLLREAEDNAANIGDTNNIIFGQLVVEMSAK